VRLNWYPTCVKVKWWITEAQLCSILTAVSSPEKRYTFTCKNTFENSPVFVKATDIGLKHTTDASPLGSYRPFNDPDLYSRLIVLGNKTGLQERLNYSCIRRSYNMKAVMKDSLPSWRLAMNMGHDINSLRLTQEVYEATIKPLNQMRIRFGA
jgi:hypothetical protein